MSNKPYKIIKQIGKGSYGIVYLCENKIKNQLCVIKRINLSKLDDKEKEDKRIKNITKTRSSKHNKIYRSIHRKKITNNIKYSNRICRWW